MFDAFEPVKLVQHLPIKICAITTYGDQFLLGTVGKGSECHLLVWKVNPATDFNKLYDAKLLRTVKNFTSKPIIQLAAVPELNVLLLLSGDGEVQCADLRNFQITPNPTRIRGAVFFAVDWQKLRSSRVLRVCVAVKKKLVVYNFTSGSGLSFNRDLPLFETAKAVAWVGESLIVCIKKDLFHLNLDGDSKELFTIGSNRADPCLHPITTAEGKGEILVLQDEKQICLDADAKPTQESALVWSDQPICIEHVHPYIIGLLPKGIEIRALEQKIQVQVLDIPEKFRFVVHDKMTLIATQSQVYKLEPKAYELQVQHLVIHRHFELALQVADLIKESDDEQKIRREEILRRFAFYLFSQLKFEKSLKYYLQIKEDPVNVIALYPHLLPSDLRQSLANPLPAQPPTLTGEDLVVGTEHLITYLTQMRYEVQQRLQQSQKGEGSGLSSEEAKQHEAKLSLIDTTLLKCYIKTNNNTLIGSLVRLRDNHLHLAESERVLRAQEKFQELVQLFQTKGQHKKALDLLSQFHKGPTSPLSGVWPTIEYLQNLGSENLDMILSYSKWVLKENPDDGLRIFTEEIKEVEQLPRQNVLTHLINVAPQLVVPYLEHIVLRWLDNKPEFHNKLILSYKQEVESKLRKYLQANKGRPRAKAGQEPDELGFVRSKLLNFLSTSKHYRASELISKFPSDELFEERALLLGKLGRHDVALAIYAHVLSDPKMADDYCKRMYDPDNEDDKDVYLELIKTYLLPTPFSELGIRLPPHRHQPQPSVDAAMAVLAEHHEHIDTAKVMGLLPPSTIIRGIEQFLTTVIEENTITRRRTHVLKSLHYAEHMQVQQIRIREQSPHFIIDDTTMCSICKKKMGTSAFARYPNGNLSHYYCHQKERGEEYTEDPNTFL